MEYILLLYIFIFIFYINVYNICVYVLYMYMCYIFVCMYNKIRKCIMKEKEEILRDGIYSNGICVMLEGIGNGM